MVPRRPIIDRFFFNFLSCGRDYRTSAPCSGPAACYATASTFWNSIPRPSSHSRRRSKSSPRHYSLSIIRHAVEFALADATPALIALAEDTASVRVSSLQLPAFGIVIRIRDTTALFGFVPEGRVLQPSCWGGAGESPAAAPGIGTLSTSRYRRRSARGSSVSIPFQATPRSTEKWIGSRLKSGSTTGIAAEQNNKTQITPWDQRLAGCEKSKPFLWFKLEPLMRIEKIPSFRS